VCVCVCVFVCEIAIPLNISGHIGQEAEWNLGLYSYFFIASLFK